LCFGFLYFINSHFTRAGNKLLTVRELDGYYLKMKMKMLIALMKKLCCSSPTKEEEKFFSVSEERLFITLSGRYRLVI